MANENEIKVPHFAGEFSARDKPSPTIPERLAAARKTLRVEPEHGCAEEAYPLAPPLGDGSPSEVFFAEPSHLLSRPFMRCWMAWTKTSNGLYYAATVGLPVLEEHEVKQLGSEVHRKWMEMKRALLSFRLLRNVVMRRNRVDSDLQEVDFEE